MPGSRRFLTRLGLVTVAAGIWRIWYVVAVADPRTPRLALSDETFYHQQARLVADGVGFVNPFGYYAPVGTPAHRVFETAVHPPAYTVFLAIPAKLGIDSVLSQRILTALLGTATVFLLGLLGRRIAGDRAGIIAAVLAAAAPALWVNDSVLGLETLYCFCLVVALLCLYRFWTKPSIAPVLGMAAALAVGALTRSEGTLLFVLIALPALLLVPGVTGLDRAKYVGATALVALLVMGPWVVRNLTTFDEPTVLGTGFGWVLVYGNCDATYHGELLGYWSDQCALQDYPPHLEESRVDLLRPAQGHRLHRRPPLARTGRGRGARRLGCGTSSAPPRTCTSTPSTNAAVTPPAGPCWWGTTCCCRSPSADWS